MALPADQDIPAISQLSMSSWSPPSRLSDTQPSSPSFSQLSSFNLLPLPLSPSSSLPSIDPMTNNNNMPIPSINDIPSLHQTNTNINPIIPIQFTFPTLPTSPSQFPAFPHISEIYAISPTPSPDAAQQLAAESDAKMAIIEQRLINDKDLFQKIEAKLRNRLNKAQRKYQREIAKYITNNDSSGDPRTIDGQIQQLVDLSDAIREKRRLIRGKRKSRIIHDIYRNRAANVALIRQIDSMEATSNHYKNMLRETEDEDLCAGQALDFAFREAKRIKEANEQTIQSLRDELDRLRHLRVTSD